MAAPPQRPPPTGPESPQRELSGGQEAAAVAPSSSPPPSTGPESPGSEAGGEDVAAAPPQPPPSTGPEPAESEVDGGQARGRGSAMDRAALGPWRIVAAEAGGRWSATAATALHRSRTAR
jgi:hypothetical protein